jgi:predicted metal-dependent hydrolase
LTFNYHLATNIIEVEHIKKTNIKHTYLKIISSNKIQIKSNIFFSKNDAINLIKQKENWITKHLHKYDKKTLLDTQFYYLGDICQKDDFNIDDLDIFYKEKAKDIILPIVQEYSKLMNVKVNKVTFRKNKTRWGSCSSLNNISLNTKLIKIPLDLIKYVVIHELSHIREKNHKKGFWDECEKYLPNCKKFDKQLKEYSCL